MDKNVKLDFWKFAKTHFWDFLQVKNEQKLGLTNIQWSDLKFFVQISPWEIGQNPILDHWQVKNEKKFELKCTNFFSGAKISKKVTSL